jgi:thioredoxin-like negative regulator of GroEL
MKNLTRENFLNRVFDYEKKQRWQYQGDKPCLIDFYDETCPPCKAIAPVLAELADEFEDRVIFYQVDVTKEEQLAQELGVSNLPTLVLCPLGDKPVVLQGNASREKVREAIERELLSGSESE